MDWFSFAVCQRNSAAGTSKVAVTLFILLHSGTRTGVSLWIALLDVRCGCLTTVISCGAAIQFSKFPRYMSILILVMLHLFL